MTKIEITGKAVIARIEKDAVFRQTLTDKAALLLQSLGYKITKPQITKQVTAKSGDKPQDVIVIKPV